MYWLTRKVSDSLYQLFINCLLFYFCFILIPAEKYQNYMQQLEIVKKSLVQMCFVVTCSFYSISSKFHIFIKTSNYFQTRAWLYFRKTIITKLNFAIEIWIIILLQKQLFCKILNDNEIINLISNILKYISTINFKCTVS